MKRSGLLLAAIVLVSCAESRPSAEAWQTEWNRVLTGIPSEVALENDAPRSVCEQGLVFIRQNRSALSPTPDVAIDDTVADWLDLAGAIYFDCPPPPGFKNAYATLNRLEAEIAVVLEIDEASASTSAPGS